MIVVLLFSKHVYHPFTPLHKYAYSSYCSQLHISLLGEFVFQSQLFRLAIISFTFMVFIINISAVLLKGEIRFLSPLGFKGLKIKLTTKHLCISSDCTRTPLLISLGKIITNNFGTSLKEVPSLLQALIQD